MANILVPAKLLTTVLYPSSINIFRLFFISSMTSFELCICFLSNTLLISICALSLPSSIPTLYPEEFNFLACPSDHVSTPPNAAPFCKSIPTFFLLILQLFMSKIFLSIASPAMNALVLKAEYIFSVITPISTACLYTDISLSLHAISTSASLSCPSLSGGHINTVSIYVPYFSALLSTK